MTATAIPESSGAAVEVDAQRKWVRWQLYLGFVGLGLGGLFGLFQALERMGYYGYDDIGLESYYQGLTIHGVALALVFTFTFANAFLSYTVIRALGRPLVSTPLVMWSFLTAAIGTAMATVAMLLNQATVLYTFYPPLEASSFFYLGAVLLVVSTWLVSLNQMLTTRAWRRDNPGEKLPLLAFVSVITYLMWDLASLGIAIEVVAFLLPWSFGWMEGTDPLVNRTLFWFTGHPIVYFWLLPAYVSWYMMIPARVGGKLYSDGIVRAVFIMFLLFSIPVGLHHQFTDPGVDDGLKFVHTILTFLVFFPSMVTAFTLLAALESGGRKRGGKGLLGWIPKLPWGSPFVTAQLHAMLVFTLGGASGLINASYTVNTVVHNTAYIPGHFHLTVGTAVALSIMGISYWFVPHLTNKKLYSKRLALAQSWLYFVGVLVFSRGLMAAGLEGQPRRIPANGTAYAPDSWAGFDMMAGIGGVLMVISGILFFYVILRTVFNKEPAGDEERAFDVSECIHDAGEAPRILDRLGVWFVAAALLVAIAYVPVFINQGISLDAPGNSAVYDPQTP
jgi:cytochrome c oxidase subunit I